MRFKQYISLHENGITSDSVDDADMWIDMIQNDCSDILELYQSGSPAIWRGDKSSYGDGAVKRDVRKDRKPVEMPAVAHRLLVDAFNAMKLPANRENSIFCTTDEDTASHWGHPYVVFPQDVFSAVSFMQLPDGENGYAFPYLKDIAERNEDKPHDEAVANIVSYIKKVMPPTVTHKVGAFQALIKRRPVDILINTGWWIGIDPQSALGHAVLEGLELHRLIK